MQPSPLAFLTPQQPPSSPSHHQPHQIPFAPLPGSQPNSGLAYGFGLSRESTFGSWRPTSSPSTSTATGFGWGQQSRPVASTGTASFSKRRKRSASPDQEQDEEEESGRLSMRDMNIEASLSSPSSRGKRARTRPGTSIAFGESKRGFGEPNSTVLGQSKGLNVVSEEEQARLDLGKELASLPPSSLLSVLTSLLTHSPHLTPLVQSLLPPPSLPTLLQSVTEAEHKVLLSIPKFQGELRMEYVLGRIRLPLEEYMEVVERGLRAFSSTTTSGDEHPSTLLSLLSHTSHSVYTILSSLPPPSSSPTTQNPLLTHLSPLILTSYQHLIARLETECNTQGKVYGERFMRGVFERLEEVERENVVGVAETVARARKALGWTVGWKEGQEVEMEEEL